MKQILTDVSRQHIRKQGILCSSVVINKDMILLHKIEKDIILDKHNHPHVQLGYCFNGDFDLEAEGNDHRLSKGHSYLLRGGVHHSATAITDYYSMDFKVMSESAVLPHQIVYDIFEYNIADNKKYNIKKAQFENFHVQIISYLQSTAVDIEIDINRKHYVVLSAPCTLHFEELSSDFRIVEPMKIYQLEADKTQFKITANNDDVEVMLITY